MAYLLIYGVLELATLPVSFLGLKMKMKYLTPIPEIDSPDTLIEELIGLKELIKHYQPSESEEDIWEELDIRITMLEAILLNTLKESNDFNTGIALKEKMKEWDEVGKK